jgi:hypothetical protein
VSTQPPAGIGAVYFPDPDVRANGSGRAAPPEQEVGRLLRLPGRRRPAMVALAVALAAAGVVVSAGLYQRADEHVPVVMVTANVPAGAVITGGDLTTTGVAVAPGVRVVPAAQLSQVSGEVAAVALRAGTLLAPSELTTAQPPARGQQLVPVAVKPSTLPASGLAPGDQVLVVATPGDQGEPGAAGTQPLAAPVAAVVAAVDTAAGSDGLDVVDLLVRAALGPAVAEQASTGQVALIVTRRG